jgi:hypothetical protein
METYNEWFLNIHFNVRNEWSESLNYPRDGSDIPTDMVIAQRNDFNNQRDDTIKQNDYSLSQKHGFSPRNCFSCNNPSYQEIVSDIFDKDFNVGENFNLISIKKESNDSAWLDAFSKNFHTDSTNGKDINYVDNKNEEEKNTIETQQNNLIINKENENYNSTTKETTSKNKSEKTNKHLGRKSKRETELQKEKPSHGIYSEDNILVKIQGHYLNFIISFLNSIFPLFNYHKKLKKLDRKFKINIKKNNLNEYLYKSTIGEIISNKISEKFKLIEDKINANRNIYEEIKHIPILKDILSQNYLKFFKKFYYFSDSYINLKDFGLNKTIILSKEVKNFNHLLKKNGKRGTEYIMSLKEYAIRNYMPELMFMCQ